MDKRNATRSWSGYVHQGRVGILVALRTLKKLVCEGVKELSNYALIYENAEDFDIQNDNKVLSRHQVKCYKDGTTISSYKKVLNVHKRNFSDGIWKIEEEGFQIHEYKDDGNIIENVVDKNERYLHTINEVIGFGLSKKDFEQLKKTNSSLHKNTKYHSNPNNIKLYEYEKNKKYCKLQSDNEDSDLTNYCLYEIEEIIKLTDPDLLDFRSIVVDRYNQLLNIIDNKICQCHMNNEINSYPVITFQEILESIIEDKHVEIDVLMLFRQLISKYWDEYHSEILSGLVELPFELDENDVDRINNVLYEIACFDESELKQFIYKIQPIEKKYEDSIAISDLNSLCTKSQIRQIFFKVLLGVKKVDLSLSDMTYHSDKSYALSLIDTQKEEIKSVIRSIIKSRVLLQNIYEKDFLINQHIDDEQVLGYFKDNMIKKHTNNWEINNDIIQYMDIRKSNLSFISIQKTIIELNGENDGKIY